MLVTTDRPTPKSSGIKSEVGFTIDPRNLAHVVSLLRDAYSDPITAVLREYSVNAADAHVEAGIPDKPFEVTLPGRLDPVLKIRDFGRGLTPEQIEGLFCSYGASSKRQSNDYTGCLGIGCKSAFAVTDSFTVTTYHGGRERTYSCYLDESEVGKAALLSDKPSTETGVLVVIPIKRDEIGTVEPKAIEVFRYFRVPPRFVNLSKSTEQRHFGRPNYLFRTAKAGIKGDANHYRSSENSCIVMGNIAYPLKESEIDNDKLRSVLTYNSIDFEVPIGTVDIAPSREELKYNPRTKAAIRKAVRDGLMDLGVSAVQQIAQATDLFSAMKIYKAVFMRHHMDGYLRGLLLEPTYKGKPLTSNEIKLYDKEEEAKANHFCVRKLRKLSSARRGKSYDFSEVRTMEIGLTDRLYHDTSSNQTEFYGRVRTLLSEPGFDAAYVFRTRNGGLDYLKQKQPLLNELQFEDFSTLAVTPPEKAAPGVQGVVDNVKHSLAVFKLKLDGISTWHRYQSEYWEPAEIDLKTDSGVYLAIEEFKVNGAPVRNLAELIKLLRRYGHNGPIYGFKPKIVERLDKTKNTNWVKFNDRFRELWTARAAPFREAFDNYTNYETHIHKDCVTHVHQLVRTSDLSKGTVAWLYQDALTRCLEVPAGVNLKREQDELDKAGAFMLLPEREPTIDLDGLSKLFFQRYPMAKFYSENRSFDSRQNLAKDKQELVSNKRLLLDYLQFVDERDPALVSITKTINQKGQTKHE